MILGRCNNIVGVAALVVIVGCAQTIAQDAPVPAVTLMGVEQEIREGRFENIHGVVVLQEGETKAEWYFEGPDERRGQPLGTVTFSAEALHDLRSVTKSIVSVLFGIALADGAINSIDEAFVSYFPDYADLVTPELSRIRLRDLLSMTSGIRWDESTYPYTDSRNSETAMDWASDRIRHILSEPIEVAPGERFNYSGGDVALIAAIIARATGTPLEEYAKSKLFDPLGITDFEWLKDGAGDPIAASGLRLRPRDMAKIGQLMLQAGRWDGQQIVPADWVETSTSFRAQIQPDLRCGTQYGYYWWLGAICDEATRIPLVRALGNGGQKIWLLREPEVVIVMTAGLYNRRNQSVDDAARAILSALSLPVSRP